MTKKPLKSWRTFAIESKERRKAKLTKEQIEKANKVFEELAQEQT